MMHKQNDLILGLTKRLDEQQTYFENQLREQSQALIKSNKPSATKIASATNKKLDD